MIDKIFEFHQGRKLDGSMYFVLSYDLNVNEYIADIFDAHIVCSDDGYIDTFPLNEAVEDSIMYQLLSG